MSGDSNPEKRDEAKPAKARAQPHAGETGAHAQAAGKRAASDSVNATEQPDPPGLASDAAPARSLEASSAPAPLLVFGAHPDDIEFGCGAVIVNETSAGRPAHSVVCSLGESASSGTPEQRVAEAKEAMALLGATVEFIELDGDSHLEMRAAHSIKLAKIIRRVRPSTVLAPTCCENQHPDHWRLGQLVREAARLARYSGLMELRDLKAHAIEQLFFYAVTPEGEPLDTMPILIDISREEIVTAWTKSMNAHVSQAASRNYVDLQLTRARLLGARAGVEYATALYPNDPMVFASLSNAGKGARRF